MSRNDVMVPLPLEAVPGIRDERLPGLRGAAGSSRADAGDASGTTGRARPPSARIFLETRWAGRVRSPVERSRVAVMRLRYREPIWMSPWEPAQARCHGRSGCNYGTNQLAFIPGRCELHL